MATKRVTATIDMDLFMQLDYWATKREISINEYLKMAIMSQIRLENKDYDLPSAEIARLNQIVDVLESLSVNSKSLEDTIISGFDSLLGLTRGDNYLLDVDDEGVVE